MNIQVRVLQGPGSAAALKQMEGQMARLNAATMGAAGAGGRLAQVMQGRHLEKYGKNLQWTGRQIAYNFTLPIMLAGGAATKWALDNERAMTRIRKVYGDASMSTRQVKEETDDLGRAFRALSDTFGVVLSEVSDVGALWAQVGAQGVAVARATRASLELMILGEMEAVEATEALIAVQAQYGLSTLELRDAIGQLNAIENNTATRLGDLIKVIQRAGGSARNAGVDIRHLAAMTASLVPATGSAERAGNALRTIIDRLLVPTTAAKNVLREMGIEVQDAAWNSMNFTDRLKTVAEAMGGLSTAAVANANSIMAGRFQVARFSTLIADFINPAGRYARALDVTSDATKNLGEQSEYMIQYQKELAIFLSSNPQRFKILVQQIRNLMTEAIGPLIPAIVGFLAKIRDLIERFGNLSGSTQQLVLAFLLFIAVTGPVIQYIGALILLFTRIFPVIKFFYGAIKTAAVAVAFVSANLFTLVRAPFSAIAFGFGMIGRAALAAMNLAYQSILFLTVGAFRLFSSLHGVVLTMVTSLPALAARVVAGFTAAYAGIVRFLGLAIAAFQSLNAFLLASIWGTISSVSSLIAIIPSLFAMLNTFLLGGIWALIGRLQVAVPAFFAAARAQALAWFAGMRLFAALAPAAFSVLNQMLVAGIWAFIGRMQAAVPAIFASTRLMMTAWVAGMTNFIGAIPAMFSILNTYLLNGIWYFITRLQVAIPGMLAAMRTTMAILVVGSQQAFGAMVLGARAAWAATAAVFHFGWQAVTLTMWAGMRTLGTTMAILPHILRQFGLFMLGMVQATRTAWASIVLSTRVAMFLITSSVFMWPAIIGAALAAVAYLFREDLSRLFQWIADNFNNIPVVAHGALSKVLQVFKSFASTIWDLIKFIFNPFAAMNQSTTKTPAAAPAIMRKDGGSVPGTGRGDKVPALLEPGEFVVRRNAVNKYGLDRLQALNEGLVQKFARGGLVQRFARGGLVQPKSPELDAFDRATAGARGAIQATERGEQRSIVVGAAPNAGPEFDAMVAAIGRLNGELDRLRAAYAAQAGAVDALKASLDAANLTLSAAEAHLSDLEDAANAAQQALSNAEGMLSNLARTPIEGMRAMSDAIFANEMAQKALRLEMLKIEQAGGSIDNVRKKLASLEGDLESLRGEREDLRMAGAGSDVLGGLDSQIAEMKKAQRELESGGAMSQFDELQKQLDALALEGEILSLQQSLTFDPLTREIDQLVNSIDEVPFDVLVAQIIAQQEEVERLRETWEAADAAVQAQQATVDAIRDRRDVIEEAYDLENAKLMEIADSYALVEDQIRSMKSALSEFVQQAQSAAAAAAAAAGGDVGSLPDVSDFQNAMGSESFEIPGGTVGMLGLEEGSIDDFIADLIKDLEVTMEMPNVFGPLKEKWLAAWGWIKDNVGTVISGVIGAIAGHMIGAAAGAKLGGAIGSIFGPLGTILGAALGLALGFAFKWVVDNVDWSTITDWIASGPLGRLWDTLGPPIEEFFGRFKEFWNNLTEMLSGEFKKWGETFARGKEAFDQVMEWLGAAFEFIRGLFGEGKLLGEAWSWLWESMGNIVQPVLDRIVPLIQGFSQVIRSVFDVIFSIITGDWDAAWEGVIGILTGAWEVIFNLFAAFIGVIIGIGTAILDVITAPFKAIYNFLVGSLIPNLINGIVTWFTNLVSWVVAPIAALVSFITTKFTEISTKAREIWDAIWLKITTIIGNVQIRISAVSEAIRLAWDTFWNAVSMKVTLIWDAVWLKVSTIATNIQSRISEFITNVRTAWDSFWNGVGTKVSGVMDPILTKVQTVTEGIKTAFENAVDAVGRTVNNLKEKLATPINWVINTAYNSGIRKFWNFIASKIGMGELDAIAPIALNSGGRVPGAGNGDTVPAMLTPGEFVIRKNAARVLGHETLARLNQADRDFVHKGQPVTHSQGGCVGCPQHLAMGGWVTGKTNGMHPEFMNRLANWAQNQLKSPYNIGSGYRSLGEQAYLYDRWIRRVPGQAPAAPPGSSNHNFGLASDGARLGNRAPDKYGLVYPMSYEPWHIEPIGAKSMRGGGPGSWEEQPDPGIVNAFREVWEMVRNLQDSAEQPVQMMRQSVSNMGRGAIGFGLDKIPLGGVIKKAIGFYNGGVVQGSRNGQLVRVGEQYQDEKIIPIGRSGRSGDEGGQTMNFYGDLSFPNISDGGDAEAFIRNLEALVD